MPGNPLIKGARYADNLESWFKEFPREQLLVIHTDDLTTATQVSPNPNPNPNPSPNPNPNPNPNLNPNPNQAGVISVLRESDLHLHLGENATGDPEVDPNKLQVG